ncbi:MAG: hypothetical protein Q9219_004279 [cf. Caloplaca sp. 3 TL-2023]
MWVPSLPSILLSTSILIPLTFGAPASVSTNPTLNAAPIHVPVCLGDPGGYDLLVCARLLAALKNLPYYDMQEVWSEYSRGDGHLPAIFSLQDRSGWRSCHLSMDLYEPGIPRTAKERFSLEQVQTDLVNVYWECLKARGEGGFNRIGLLGNIAAVLGPPLDTENPLLARFKNLNGNKTDDNKFRKIDLTPYVRLDNSA